MVTGVYDGDDFPARSYQQQIFDVCCKRNAIIYLPTGAGKTYISIMLMKYYAHMLEGNIEDGGKRTLFLVNTVALAKQQHEYIKKSTPFKVVVYTGDLNVDNWKNDKWLNEFNVNQVIVATCQIIVDCIRHNYLKVSNINLIIFDECHHAQGDHIMKQLMDLINCTARNDQPRVIGLTGLLLKNTVKPEHVIQTIERLEQVYQSNVVTVQNLDEYHNVLLYSTHPAELLIKYGTNSSWSIIEEVKKLVNSQIEIISNWNLPRNPREINSKTLRILAVAKSAKPLVNLFKDYLYQLNEFGVYGGAIAILSVLVELEIKRRSGEIMYYRKLISSCITKTEQIRHMLENYMNSFNQDDNSDDDDTDEENKAKCQITKLNEERYRIYKFSTNKIIKLLEKLKDYGSKTDLTKLKCLVFVQRRYTAKCLFYIIKNFFKYDDKLNIMPDFMVGVNNSIPDSIESILEFKWNRNTLQKFKNDEINLIVASSVLEEGIDLQECNLVITYDNPKTFCSYVQTKGRARMDNSEYVILVDIMEVNKFLSAISTYRQIDEIMKKFLLCKAIDRQPPLEFDKSLDGELNVPPFLSKEGAILDIKAAIQLLYRYCQQLPIDNQVDACIAWSLVEISNKNKKLVKLSLPLQSKIKDDIYGKEMSNTSNAKRSAAFEACIKLYKANEFDEHFLPISKKKLTTQYTDIYFPHWTDLSIINNNNNDDTKITGTKKNINYYKQKYPIQLNNCLPNINKPLYLYKILMKAQKHDMMDNVSNEIKEKFTNIFNTKKMYGILTTKQLPKLPLIKLFLKYIDCIDINIIFLKKLSIINKNDINTLKNFHKMLFNDIMQIKHNFVVNDYTNGNQSYLIVPISDENAINWKLIRTYQQLPKLHQMDIIERQQLNLDNVKEDYLNKVIHPWYRFDTKSRYMVINVLDHLTPLSPFPNNEFKNYKQYFCNKYCIEVLNDRQCLIEVKGISNNLKCLKPEVLTNIDKKFTKEVLIPEFCNNLSYPGDMWLKALLLPSVLHRLTYLLHADNLRNDIIKYLNVENLLIDSDDNGDNDIAANIKPLIIEKYLLNDKNNDDEDDDPNDDIDDNDDVNFINQNHHPKKVRMLMPNELCDEIKKLSINNLKDCYDQDKYAWKLSEEPVDIQRTWDTIYPIELDYYMSFIKQFEFMNTAETTQCLELNRQILNTKQLLQICDEDINIKMNIKLLKLDDYFGGGDDSDGGKFKFEISAILSSITTVKSNDVFNMERYELLGDTFLKFSISTYLLHHHIDFHEGHLTELKSKFVSNKNLLILGIKKGLPSIIKNNDFNPSTDWKPPLFDLPPKLIEAINEHNITPRALLKVHLTEEEVLQGDINEDNLDVFVLSNMTDKNYEENTTTMHNFFDVHMLNDKTISDSLESILGVCLHSFGINRTFKMLCYFGIVPNDDDITNLLKNLVIKPCLTDNYTMRDIDVHLINFQILEASLGYTFKNRGYLLQALTHSSYPLNRLTNCYQQFEFLGDSVIDLLITSFIFEQCDSMDPGQLTDLRASLVNNTTLACVCVRLNFHKFILLSNYRISELINNFAQYQNNNQHKITDNVELLLNDDETLIGEYICVPKILGDIFEALIAAVFLDTNKNLTATWKVLYNLMSDEINQFIANTPKQVVRRLYEFPSAHPKFSNPIITDDKVMISVRFTCRNEILEVFGFGENKDDAKKSAAKMALVKLIET